MDFRLSMYLSIPPKRSREDLEAAWTSRHMTYFYFLGVKKLLSNRLLKLQKSLTLQKLLQLENKVTDLLSFMILFYHAKVSTLLDKDDDKLISEGDKRCYDGAVFPLPTVHSFLYANDILTVAVYQSWIHLFDPVHV